jgi:hypothetical protein
MSDEIETPSPKPGVSIWELAFRADRILFGQVVGDLHVTAPTCGVETFGMLKPVEIVDGENDVVGVALADAAWDVIEVECVPQLPGDDVIGARGVAAYPQATE